MPLTLECAGAATLSSAYLVVMLNRKDVASGDLPPVFGTSLAGITTLDGAIANWGLSPALPTPTHGTWNATTTYTTGNTVASIRWTIRNTSGSLNKPVVYKSLQTGNVGHDPDNYDGYWTCITQPPHADVLNTNYQSVFFGYALSPLPTSSTLPAATWKASLGHSLSWLVTAPGDIVQLGDIYVILNYLLGSTLVKQVSRPLTHSETTGSQGFIANPGGNAQFQCWFASGLSSTPELTLTGWQDKFINGMQPGATTGSTYLTALAASGGTTPYVYGIVKGGLPPGVSLDPETGVISGTPTVSGLFNFTAQVTDAAGATAQVTCAVPVDCGGGGVVNSFF